MASDIISGSNFGLGDPVKPVETTLASAATLAPTTQVTIVTGTVAVATITPPWTGFAGSLDLVYTDASPAATTTTGNIALVTTVVRYKTLRMTYSQINSKWYPSY
jgi:hypothetical protein